MLKKTYNTELFPLQAQNLTFAIGDKTLVKQLSFTINGESITTIMGPNGAGKSLTLRLLHGLLKPTSGKIIWGNFEKTDQHTKTIKHQQAMVFRKPVLLRRSVKDNLAYALKINGIKEKPKQTSLIENALALANLSHLAKNPARKLSGGEQQRLAIARAMMTKPTILFLDEPTSSLDPGATKAVEDLIKTASIAGTKIVLVTHDIGQAKRLAGDIIFLAGGELKEQGPAETLLTSPTSKAARQYLNGEIVTS